MGKQKAVSKDLTEKILRECHEIYTEGDDCLTNVADLLGEKLLGNSFSSGIFDDYFSSAKEDHSYADGQSFCWKIVVY